MDTMQYNTNKTSTQIHTYKVSGRKNRVFTMYVEEFSHIHVVAKVLCPWDRTLTNINVTAAHRVRNLIPRGSFFDGLFQPRLLHTGKNCSQQTAIHLPKSHHHRPFRNETRPPQ